RVRLANANATAATRVGAELARPAIAGGSNGPGAASCAPTRRRSAAIATDTSAISSGSVIGVDCRYSTFGFSANTAAAAIDAATDSVRSRTIHAIAAGG